MNTKLTKNLLGTAATLCLLAITGQAAQAGTFHDGWNYSIDSFNDGTEGWVVGDNSKFEFYGMAYQETDSQITFAVNSNLSLNGYAEHNARNGKISYGDLLLNFSNPNNFNSANGSLYGIRFDQTNDTQVGIGLYSNVTSTSVAGQNDGYTWQGWHTTAVNNWMHQTASYGDLEEGTGSYFNSAEAAPTSIGAGTYVGAVSMINDFTNMGLDFAHFNTKGTYTFGFSIDKSLLPVGDFVASLFAECGNDGVALLGEVSAIPEPPSPDTKDVPEPSALAGLAFVGLVAGANRLRHRKDRAIA